MDLKSLVPSHYSSRIVFLGRYDSDSLPSILSNSLIYVNTSSSDAGLASSTQEALAAGLPVVSTDVCDNAYWLDSSKCDAILYRIGVDSLSRKLLEAINTTIDFPTWGLKNQDYAQRTFSVDSQRKLISSLYSPLTWTPEVAPR